MSFEARVSKASEPPSQRIVKMEEKNGPPPSKIFETANAGISFEAQAPKRTAPTQRIVRMAESKEVAPSTFESANSGMSFEPRVSKASESPTQRIVKMAEKKEAAPSTFESANSGMSFEAQVPKRTTPTQRIVKMTENKEVAPSTFESANSGMSFEAQVPKRTTPTQRIVKMTEKKETPTSKVFQGDSDSMSFEARRPSRTTSPEKENVDSTTDERSRIAREIEKEISQENRLLSILATEKKRLEVARNVQERKRAEEAQVNGDASVQGETQPKVVAAEISNDPLSTKAASSSPGYGLFQRAKRPAVFESDGSQFVTTDQSDFQKERLQYAKKMAEYKKMAEVFGTRKNSPAAFVTDDTGMNMVITKRVKQPTAATASNNSSPRLNPSGDGPVASSDNLPRVSPPNSSNNNNGSMKMLSSVATELRKESVTDVGGLKSIQQSSKMDVNSAKKTASDIRKFAQFVSDGLQMVSNDAQKMEKATTVTPAEARRNNKQRELKDIFGFDIDRDKKDEKIKDAGRKSSEEILATQLMEGGKNVAKFAFDGLQMVYRVAEKQTKEYIASSAAAAAEENANNNSKSATTNAAAAAADVSSKPFFAATATDNDNDNDNNKGITTKDSSTKKALATANDSPKPFFAATTEGNDNNVKKKVATTKMDSSSSTNHDNNISTPTATTTASSTTTTTADDSSPKPFFAATATGRNDDVVKKVMKTTTKIDSSSSSSPPPSTRSMPPSSTSSSSLLRSGGRMFVKFVGDGLQMVQRVASSSSSKK
jgi:hypothetical protein